MFDVMVDIETTGTDPEHTAILQIAAVVFDLEKKEIDVEHMFSRCLWMAPRRFWQEDTRQWWARQKQEVLDGIMDAAEDPGTVMRAFHTWTLDAQARAFTDLRFWAKPTSFDYPFVASYFSQHDLMNPFDFRLARDLNTWIDAKGQNPREFWKTIEPVGDAHNALNDVIYQISGLFAL